MVVLTRSLLVTNILSVVFQAHHTSGKLFTDPTQLSASKQYDYIVVGAGPGGSVIANRLTEDVGVYVLLVEAGPSDEGVLAIHAPFLMYQLEPDKPYDWNYTTIPQSALEGRAVDYSRGRVLGGSTSINTMAYTRSSRDDFDKYANLTGDAGWSWDSIQPYFKKIERLVPPVDGHNTTDQVDASIHGFQGYLNITLPNAPLPSDPHVIGTTAELENDFPFNLDMNSGNPLGIGWSQSTTGNGMRSSAATSYLHPFLSRSNLDVLVNTTVTKLIKTGLQDGLPTFLRVEMAQSNTSYRHTFEASREAIISGGAVNTPQILMLSGIGPSAHISSHGITPLVDLPAVGQNLADHPRVGNQFSVASVADDAVDPVLRNTTLLDALIQQWETNRSGIIGSLGTNQIGWLRIPEDDPIWETEEDPSAGPTSPHYECLFRPGYLSTSGEPAPTTGFFFSISSVLVSPSSRGSITLASSEPFTAPIIDPAFLSTSFDIAAMRYAIRAAARYVSAPTWNGYVTGQAASFANVSLASDASVDAHARSQASSIFHPVGTVRMGRCEDLEGSAVNPDLTVKGTRGLRVVDASVFPFIPGAHPQAVVYAFAERAADLIKQGTSFC